ncbi:MAG: 50S ribosomal protein L11 methyltransferase [Flavobacteriaceae bacterium CG_4_8_14_3_um_filter_34_10]|nr:50S ribosomal protein L11 methyltransferase [Flavobacteriia bacterium]OIP51997.1 MAG: ribosomal protein L11 methyltransferase [Flavobacteriaceae bacterium CG2_30_34_30]PIQ17562.1 MAG: 50S ribosomal protein L11 methyltransferase [Flavobacteriaceae bacterium CG18_big_fil_WC_8_21_14_2_50_34_36]PIV49710.1 MAG: 50S ribosomal protein L11 methyltransferase [Flavobacteriaceae bacterium CG02_land_8_20_14_3_00_34_13]PIX08892.1 MAG: 50S ribosomal protein L11 methyltransferase [Flavobacteriaceae bacteri
MEFIYLEFDVKVNPLEPWRDILIAELGDVGFESFIETEEGFLGYIQKKDWKDTLLEEIELLNNKKITVSFSKKEIEQVNWNEEWEKNFEPILVDDICSVRAPFHEKPDVEYDIIIEPKMSFGTGHHETTHMMIQHILKNNWESKKVLDMGCGTAVLAILAEMKGAKAIDAIDIDNWCYENSLENVERNHCKHITVYEGDAALLKGKKYDTIIANINRNILLQDMASYADSLHANGELYLSGFYVEDLPLITAECNKHGLTYVENLERNRWVGVKFVN